MRCSPFLISFLLGIFVISLYGQITPNAPIKNFRLPRFGDNGYTQWVLQGASGIFDREEQVRVEDMSMRVYSGNERMALELSMDSPQATLHLQENRAYSDESIEIVGANFKISGVSWEWSGESGEIVVKSHVIVTFTQGIAGAFRNSVNQLNTEAKTEIRSDRLLLRTSDEAYYFEFINEVNAVSEEMNITCEQLTAWADLPKANKSRLPITTPEELESIHRIVASGDIVINQSGKTVRGNQAQFLPRVQSVQILGDASIEMKSAYLGGEIIRSQHGEILISGAERVGRAQMIISDMGGLGLQGSTALASETIVLADNLIMREKPTENNYLFEGSVEVMSGELYLSSDNLRIISYSLGAVIAKADDNLRVGEVKNMTANGAVHIEHSNQVATSDKVIFYPSSEQAILTGNPKVVNMEAVITGHSIELKPKRAVVRGEALSPVLVRLPEMPNLGYVTSIPGVTKSTELTADSQVQMQQTMVKSQILRMIEETDHTNFLFTNDVQVSATNLNVTCERLYLITKELAEADILTKKELELQRIEAFDKVKISQIGRTTTSEKAFIFPQEARLVLEGNAIVEDIEGRVSGNRITLLKDQRRAIVEGGGSNSDRARITLPSIPSNL